MQLLYVLIFNAINTFWVLNKIASSNFIKNNVVKDLPTFIDIPVVAFA